MPNARFLTHNDRAYRREKIVSAFQSGSPPVALAERYSLTEGHVRRVLREAGVAKPGRPWAYRRFRPKYAEQPVHPKGDAGLA